MYQRDRKEFGRRFKAARKERRWTVTALAEAAGVSRGTIHAWEAARQEPSATALMPVCAVLGVSYAVASCWGLPEASQ